MKKYSQGHDNASGSFHQRLNAYALAASSAGVTLLALAEPSTAEIIYTPAHHVIADRGSYRLDLNHDGTTDLTIQNNYVHSCTTDSCHTSEDLVTKLSETNQVVYNFYGAVALKKGMQIGHGKAFRGGAERMVNVNSLSYPMGSWINVKSRYLGIKFKIKGQIHYGWARLNVQVEMPLTITATLTGYAYETIPGKSIKTGQTFDILPPAPDSLSPDDPGPGASLTNPIPDNSQPASLGLLALGAPGLAIWRREESVDAKP